MTNLENTLATLGENLVKGLAVAAVAGDGEISSVEVVAQPEGEAFEFYLGVRPVNQELAVLAETFNPKADA